MLFCSKIKIQNCCEGITIPLNLKEYVLKERPQQSHVKFVVLLLGKITSKSQLRHFFSISPNPNPMKACHQHFV